MKESGLAAVVFDFDGVIVNTEPLHHAAFCEVLRPLGVDFTWEQYVSHFLGFDDRDAISEAFRKAGREIGAGPLRHLIDAKAAAFERLAAERGAEPYPGVESLIRRLSGAVPLALCSGALRRDVEPILRRLALWDRFGVMVTADEVAASKPDPVSYALAVERLSAAYPDRGIVPPRCVAIEDTPAGIEAARGAGLKVLALPNSYDRARLRTAHHILDTLENVNLGDLERLVAAPGGEGGCQGAS